MIGNDLQKAVERVRLGIKNPLYYAFPIQPRGQANKDAAFIVDAYLTLDERLRGLIEDYLGMGAVAERAGDCRRAAAYRSVANMLGAAVQGSEPLAVDFLARFAGEGTP